MELNNEFEVAMPVDDAWAVLTDIEKIAPCMPGAELKEVEGDEYRGIVKVKVGPITASYKGIARFEDLDPKAHKAVLKAEGRETRGQGNATALITATLSPSTKGTKVEVATDLAITGKVAQFGRGVLADVSAKLLDQFVHNLESTVLASPDATAPAAATTGGKSDDAPAADSNGSSAAQAAEEVATTRARRSRAKAAPATATTASSGAATGDEAGTEGGSASDAQAEAKAEPKVKAAEKKAQDAPEPSKEPAADAGPRQIFSPPAEPVDLVDVAGGSVMKRLAPYLTVAGILLIARIVVYSLRRRRR